MSNQETIFSKIIRREISADIVYEDDLVLAFKDIAPQAPTHILLIPKKTIESLDELTATDQDLMGHMMLKVPQIAKQAELENGYRVVINTGQDGAQTVFHLHLHILGGRQMQWPPG
ncbi:MAG: histidine triad nucleotide-binding protein [Microcoleaceae cyanobacterium]